MTAHHPHLPYRILSRAEPSAIAFFLLIGAVLSDTLPLHDGRLPTAHASHVEVSLTCISEIWAEITPSNGGRVCIIARGTMCPVFTRLRGMPQAHAYLKKMSFRGKLRRKTLRCQVTFDQ